MKKEKIAKPRRKAIDCKLIEPSKTSPGYFKYAITIQELDNSVHTVPAYGLDMQDAIRRLLKNERDVKVKKVYLNKIEPISLAVVFSLWLCAVVTSIITSNYKYAYYGVFTLFTATFILSAYKFIKEVMK